MVVANTKIQVGNKCFGEGQTVTGLPSFLIDFYEKKGIVSKTQDKKSELKKQEAEKGEKNELQG